MGTRWMRAGLVCAALASVFGGLAPGAQAEEPPPEKAPPPGAEKLPKCVGVRGEARFSGYGYDHLVEIDNRCDKSVSCTVATDVNPQAQAVSVNSGEKRSVKTFSGSPASAFKPDVACKLSS